MNQTTLKNFAQEARRELLKQVALRLNYWIGGEGAKSRVDSAEHRQFAPQVKELEAAVRLEGRDALIERVAYTWFNRLAALRFMDANGYHPFGAKVVMPATANDTLPELLQQARAGTVDPELRACFGNAKAFDDLLAGKIPVPHLETAVYRALLVAACNYYQRLMPFMFEKIGDATELLLPEDLLTEHSILNAFRTELADDDCRDVEVIGWLYQYYISDKKDEVMGRNSAVPKEDIPAVTQLFTPHWIVRYLVENSLGRLWLLNRPNSRLREKMPYYIEGEVETDFLKIGTPEEIRICDPACGSGHMLTYAYDLLYAIYAEEGYDEKDIPGLILKHNLYGVEICDRAAALAAFALCMKARASDRRFFTRARRGDGATGGQGDTETSRKVTMSQCPNVLALQDVRFDEGELSAYFTAIGMQPSGLHPDFLKLLHQFEEAKNFGSLIQPCLDAQTIAVSRRTIEAKILGDQLFLRETHIKVLRVLEQGEALTQPYHVVVANPPYMGPYSMNALLKVLAKECFEDCKADTFAMFISRALCLALKGGAVGMVTMQAWMFTGSFEDFRRRLFRESLISSLVHLGPRAFDSISGEVVQTVAFVITTAAPESRKGTYIDLTKGCSEEEKSRQLEELLQAPSPRHVFSSSSASFRQLPGAPVAYWLSPAGVEAFRDGIPLGSVCVPKKGMTSSDNARFLRRWQEVGLNRIAFNCPDADSALKTAKKWVPYSKGGEFRKWYGNNYYLINWEHDGREVVAFAAELYGSASRQIQNVDSYFQPSVTWSEVGAGPTAGRQQLAGFIFDSTGPSLFGSDKARVIALTLLCTNVANLFARALNPTLHLTVRNVAALPVPKGIDDSARDHLPRIAAECVVVARADWDSFETSWDFRDLPVLRSGQWTVGGGQPGGDWKGATLEESWNNWKSYCDAAIRRMQELETENNRLFIDAYGLQDELKPEVPEEQITLARADARKDMAAFVSYAVGCMFGRYSLDAPGLILADAGATVAEYLAKVPNPTFPPDEDGILPVLDGEWFADDIVARFREFLKATFGEAKLEENMVFVEASLEKDLRKYFVREFYRNHLSNERAYGYKKRPIYWMVSSPEGSFQALIYLHRYTRDTMNLLLNDYVREFIHKLEERQRHLTAVRLNESARAGDRTKAVKELGKIEKMLKELREWERDILLPLAQQRVEIDLDDGVKVNYLKFKGVLAPIPGLEKKDEE